MDPDPKAAFGPSPRIGTAVGDRDYFALARGAIDVRTLRECQKQALAALKDFYAAGGAKAACVMSVGAGKTALGVAALLAVARRRALVVTPGNVIRGTFDNALDHRAVGNALYGLRGGPLIPGCRPPSVLTVDREAGGVRKVDREKLLAADVIVTNFHSLGSGQDPDDLLAKLTRNREELEVLGDGHQCKPYLHVSELVDAMLFIWRNAGNERRAIYNIGPRDDGVQVADIAAAVVRASRTNALIRYTGGDRGWVGDVPTFRYSVEKLLRLGWRPARSSAEAVHQAVFELATEKGFR